MVDLVTEKFAWGLNALGALIGIKGKEALGLKVAPDESVGGGAIPEIKELHQAGEELEAALAKPNNDQEISVKRKAAASELADIFTMVMAWGKRLGITDESLNAELQKSCSKYSGRFKNILEFVKRGYVQAQDIAGNVKGEQLKKNGKLFDVLWCAIKNQEAKLQKTPELFGTLWRAFSKHRQVAEANPSKFFKQLWQQIGETDVKADQNFDPARA